MIAYTVMTSDWLQQQVKHYPAGESLISDDPYGEAALEIGGVEYLSGNYDSWGQFAVFNLAEYGKVIAQELINSRAELTTLRAENERLRDKLGNIASDDWNNADWVRDFAKEALK